MNSQPEETIDLSMSVEESARLMAGILSLHPEGLTKDELSTRAECLQDQWRDFQVSKVIWELWRNGEVCLDVVDDDPDDISVHYIGDE